MPPESAAKPNWNKVLKVPGKYERYEKMMDLSLTDEINEINGDIGTLEEALQQFTALEILDKDNKYNCSREDVARKTVVEKEKKKQTDVQYDKGHRTRCSPSEFAKTYIGFSNQKKALVHEMRFGAMAENASNYNFSNLIMMELVDSFHIPDSTIRTNIGRFKVHATKVGHALGLNATRGLYRQKMLKKEVPREQYKAADKFRKKSLVDLRDMVTQTALDTEENITKFKSVFILYVQKAILCPNNSKPLSPKTLPTILDVTNLRAMNWGRHVYSFLLNGITEMKKKNLKSVDGCVFALLIIYFQETYFGVDSEEADAQPPWLEYWKDNTLKRRIKYEFEDPAGLAHQARSRTLTRTQKKIKTKIKIPPTQNEIMNSTLAKLQIEGPSQKKILGKRKQIEEEKSSSESEPEIESESELELESESETASDSNLEKTISEDENVGNIKRRTKKRHEAINAAPLQPPQHAEADANPAATIDENVGRIERRAKKRHETINAAPLQPPQHAEADANPAAAIDALVDPSSQSKHQPF
ncbi:hypothetical protein PIB30_052664 [Stylosanthes scabra]|uniref:DUF1985 domain-containing protein n=1 Tax=Stylosanthes scabra TaxID=79078 RepID=A0ABU6QIZ9_9FABA|nr:hypothetical protein [Stylosanthes scabra]